MKIFKFIFLILIFTIFSCDNFDLTEDKVELNKGYSGSRYLPVDELMQADNFITELSDWKTDFHLDGVYVYYVIVNHGEVIVGSKKKYFISVSHQTYITDSIFDDIDFKTRTGRGYFELPNVYIEFLFGDHTTPMIIDRNFEKYVIYETDLYDLNHDFNIRTLKFDIEYKDEDWYDINQNTHNFKKTVIDKPVRPADLVSTAVINPGNNLSLTATNKIVLKPGFHAKEGSTFSAKIQ